ncbi:MAG TPA: enoyl-CoA hydratase/isomerase family protein, partial [Terriglobales bacterium]|nr:enoyl-CoA hydratase/isomerase family protein [Terriglobales bacterium]
MKSFKGQAISWELKDGVIELSLHREPGNEIGLLTLGELEKFVEALRRLEDQAHALIIYSTINAGFSAGADLRELYDGVRRLGKADAVQPVREFLQRIHQVMNALDACPLTTIAAVHGVVFGGGFELALTCDLIIA